MALSGSFSGSIKDGHYKVRIDWTATQNVANNTSTITAKMYLVNDWALSISARSSAHSITIDGTKTTLSSSAISTTGSHLIGTVTQTVEHNSDGTKTVPISAVFAIKANLGGYYENITASTTITLDAIPRASIPTLSASSVIMGNSVTITTNRASTSFMHKLTYEFGATSGTIATDVGDSASWTLSKNLAKQIPNDTSGTVTIICKTYKDGTWLGTKKVTLTATVPTSIKPSISAITVTDPTGYLATYGGYIQGRSKANIVVEAAGSYSSTIKSYKITLNGTNYTGNNCLTGVLTVKGTNTVNVIVTDSRGRTATSTATILVLEYNTPYIKKFTAKRYDTRLKTGVEDENGEYIKYGIEAEITSLNDINSKSFVVEYRANGETEWIELLNWTFSYSLKTAVSPAEGELILVDGVWTYCVDGVADYTFNGVCAGINGDLAVIDGVIDRSLVQGSLRCLSFLASVDSAYEVKLTVTDDFATNSIVVNVGTGFSLIDFNASAKGIAFGKVSEKDSFECNMDTEFKNVRTQAGVDLDVLNNNLENQLTTFSVSMLSSLDVTLPSDGIYMIVFIESLTTTSRKNPSFGFFYKNGDYIFGNIQASSNSEYTGWTYSGSTITLEFSTNQYLTCRLVSLNELNSN